MLLVERPVTACSPRRSHVANPAIATSTMIMPLCWKCSNTACNNNMSSVRACFSVAAIPTCREDRHRNQDQHNATHQEHSALSPECARENPTILHDRLNEPYPGLQLQEPRGPLPTMSARSQMLAKIEYNLADRALHRQTWQLLERCVAPVRQRRG